MGIHLVKSMPQTTIEPVRPRLHGWLQKAIGSMATSAKERRNTRQQIRLVEKLELGGRRQLLLVSCAGERFLVGAGPEQVQSILRVRPDAAEQGRQTAGVGFGDRR